MPQWEYRKIDLNEVPRRTDDIDLLNDAGKDGWEVIDITTNNVAYLKRRLDDDAPAKELPPAKRARRRTVSSDSADA